MNNLKTYLIALINHTLEKTKAEQNRLAINKATGLPHDKSELHYLDGVHHGFTTVLKHIEEIENEHA